MGEVVEPSVIRLFLKKRRDMLKGIDVNEVKEYVSEQDKSENPTKFLIKNISTRAKMTIFSGALDKEGQFNVANMQDKALDIFKAGIKEIKNLGEVDYKDITDDVINLLPFTVIIEVVGKILDFNFVSEGETKN